MIALASCPQAHSLPTGPQHDSDMIIEYVCVNMNYYTLILIINHTYVHLSYLYNQPTPLLGHAHDNSATF